MKVQHIFFLSIHTHPGPEAVPLASACLASHVRATFSSLSILEAFVHENVDSIIQRLEQEIRDRRLDASGTGTIIALSLYSWNRVLSIELGRQCRGRFPKAVLVAGGPEVSARPEGLALSSGGPFHALFQGEGESVFGEFLMLLEKTPETLPELWQGGAEDLTSLESPWLNDLLSGRSGALWELARGCPYACSYCYESKGNHRLRYLSDERFHKELAWFTDHRVPSVFVLDPTFNAQNKRAVEILDALIAANTGIHWHFEVRAELLTREQAQRFAQLGASLQIGLQTANPEVSKRVGRPLNPGKFRQKIDLLNQEGVVFGLDLMYGLPTDTLDGFMDSIDFALSLYPNHLDIFRLSVLPGTQLAEEASQYGLVSASEPPYELISSNSFSKNAMEQAAHLARAVDFFYNSGRAVPWFNQVLYPLKELPSRFLWSFAKFMDGKCKDWDSCLDPSYPASRDALLLEYLDTRYEKKKLEYLLPAVWDVVRFHSAWARAQAEGISTIIDCNYDPDQLLSGEIQDLEEFCSLADFQPCRIEVCPGATGPEVVFIA
ncbi:MAG: radical SAM protein [Termitinemataceae bacterium]